MIDVNLWVERAWVSLFFVCRVLRHAHLIDLYIDIRR